MALPYFLDPFGVGKKSVPRYGFRIDESNPSPEIERIYDSVGMVANVGTSLVDNPRNDFDGVYPFNSISKETIAGNVMVKIPKFYISRKRYEDGGKWYFEVAICETKFDESYVPHEMFLRGNVQYFGQNPDGDYNDYTYVAAYETSNNKSTSGVMPQVSQTRATHRANARTIGDGWTIQDIATWDGLWTLFHVVFANRNSQAVMRGNYSNARKPTGLTDNSSASCVQIDNISMSFYGIENLYGNVYKWTDGANTNGIYAYVCTRIPDYEDNTSDNYIHVGYNRIIAAGYITNLGFDPNAPFARFATAVGGNAEIFYCDYQYAYSAWNAVAVGGTQTGVEQQGVSFFYNLSSTVAPADAGSRLAYRPF